MQIKEGKQKDCVEQRRCNHIFGLCFQRKRIMLCLNLGCVPMPLKPTGGIDAMLPVKKRVK
jgi:hypothetical protein